MMPRADSSSNDPRAGMRWFFFVAAAIFVVVIAVGFAPTFYLRGLLESHVLEGALTPYIILHGIVLTSWYGLFLAQTWLVATGRTGRHRALGRAGAVLAFCLLALSTIVVLNAPARDAAVGATAGQIALEVVGDLGILALFAGLVTVALLKRNHPDVHKRLMAFASVGIIAPALARWPGAAAFLPFSVVVPQFAFFGALVTYDLRTRHRVHPATAWGIASYVFVVGASVAFAASALGREFIQALM